MRKSPRVSENRLQKLLNPAGFHRGTPWYSSWSWTRWNTRLGVSEWILVGFAGKRNEAVSAYCGVGITKFLAFGINHQLIMEVADVKEFVDEHGFWLRGRGRASIETTERAKQWEAQMASIAPTRATEMAAEVCPEMLERTESARMAVNNYLQYLDSTEEISNQLSYLRQQAEPAHIVDAQRLASWPGVLQVADAEDEYFLATLCILTFERRVERSTTSFVGSDPLENDELMWRIQLLTDALLAAQTERRSTQYRSSSSN